MTVPVLALWSAPRARSTAFFRSMVERGDLQTLHEPFFDLLSSGQTVADETTFDSADALLGWLRDRTRDLSVFLKETTDHRYEPVLADRRFLAEARHAFLIRRPEEIVASYRALYPEMRRHEVGLEALHELHGAVAAAGGHAPIVIDSDDLVTRPEATMKAYCAAVELPFDPQALSWEPGERPEWQATARWHTEVSASRGFEARSARSTDASEADDQLREFAAHHLPFYEQLRARRLDLSAWESTGEA